MLDAVALAITSETLLVCDDRARRGMHAAGGGKLSAWLPAFCLRRARKAASRRPTLRRTPST